MSIKSHSIFAKYMVETKHVRRWYIYRSRYPGTTRIKLVRNLIEPCFSLFHDVAHDPLLGNARVYSPFWSTSKGRAIDYNRVPVCGCLVIDFFDPNDAFLFKMKYEGVIG